MPTCRLAPLLALALALAAAPPARGERELIGYRGADGSVGVVDHRDKVPPGAEVISVKPIPAVDEAVPPEGGDAPPAALDPGAEPGIEPAFDSGAVPDAELPADEPTEPAPPAKSVPRAVELEQRRCAAFGIDYYPGCARDAALRCDHFGLASGCAAERVVEAEHWCDRGEKARAARLEAEADLEWWREALERCEQGRRACSRRDLERAQLDVERAERAEDQLDDACRSAGCLPGWVREGCLPPWARDGA